MKTSLAQAQPGAGELRILLTLSRELLQHDDVNSSLQLVDVGTRMLALAVPAHAAVAALAAAWDHDLEPAQREGTGERCRSCRSWRLRRWARARTACLHGETLQCRHAGVVGRSWPALPVRSAGLRRTAVASFLALRSRAFRGHAVVERVVVASNFRRVQHVCKHRLQLGRVPLRSVALFGMDVMPDFAVLRVG
jgi:hypothetical protein